MDRLVLWLGRSPVLGFAISRVAFAVAATWQIGAMFDPELDFAHAVALMQSGLWLWTILGIAQHVLSPPLGLLLRPLTLIVDAIIFLTVIALCQPLQIVALACLFFVAWSASERFGRGSIIVLALCLILAFLARGSYESWAAERHVAEADRAIDGITVIIGCTIAAAMLSMSILERRLIGWSERLQAVGLSFQKSLPRFVVEQISELMTARYCAFVWQVGDGAAHCEFADANGVSSIPLPQQQVVALTSISPADAPFAYAGQSSRVLLRNCLGIIRTEKAAHLMEAASS
ncbi:MAG TPA: sensor histidine kinase, partial [Sphingobium sp.]|nr:sensor histidine kinase [Sphingobium sp.]